jgi:hypothetical protein
MEQRRIPMQPDTIEQINRFDNSIAHFSTELVRMDLKRKSLFENIDSLYQGRQSILDKMMTEVGIDPSQIVQMKSGKGPDGSDEMHVLIKPSPPMTDGPANTGMESSEPK